MHTILNAQLTIAAVKVCGSVLEVAAKYLDALLYSAVWQRDFDGIVGEFGLFGVIPFLDLLEQRKTFRMESRLAARCQISPFWCGWYKTLGLNRHICTPHTPESIAYFRKKFSLQTELQLDRFFTALSNKSNRQ
jgi:hypothetical protein